MLKGRGSVEKGGESGRIEPGNKYELILRKRRVSTLDRHLRNSSERGKETLRKRGEE